MNDTNKKDLYVEIDVSSFTKLRNDKAKSLGIDYYWTSDLENEIGLDGFRVKPSTTNNPTALIFKVNDMNKFMLAVIKGELSYKFL